ncbi:DUF4158 domain-containing protein [Streptomyces sp. ok210]|uniref:DUF4158 domain-containing protein n=1 Tax=Streptomyces sp. ok210 TaxID=1761905 RepID=UPI0008F28C00|nr:DUF4158 domain-containing protein [Streptomyces sp. ok210]SFT29839.1 protein of unknown function [Streptomyces sp. ok210]
MPTCVFADDELERLRGFPDINREELIRFFTLTPVDVGFIDPGRGCSPKDRIGLAVQLCTLPWLGFVPDDVASAPTTAGPPQCCGAGATARRPKLEAEGRLRRRFAHPGRLEPTLVLADKRASLQSCAPPQASR